MPALSNADIEKELIRKNILIYPFNRNNIKGASYNFTVSRFAYKLPTRPEDSYETCYDPINKEVIIPPRSTVIVATEESIWVSPRISGTYHSKVKLVSRGLGHIGTTLDPTFLGTSFVALHNVSEREERLSLKKEENKEPDTFVSITFYYLKTEATNKYQEFHDNDPGRRDLVDDIKPNAEDSEWLRADFRVKKEALERRLANDPSYKKLKDSHAEWRQVARFLAPYVICSFVIVMGIYLSGFSGQRLAFFTDKIVPGLIGALLVTAVFDIRRRY